MKWTLFSLLLLGRLGSLFGMRIKPSKERENRTQVSIKKNKTNNIRHCIHNQQDIDKTSKRRQEKNKSRKMSRTFRCLSWTKQTWKRLRLAMSRFGFNRKSNKKNRRKIKHKIILRLWEIWNIPRPNGIKTKRGKNSKK